MTLVARPSASPRPLEKLESGAEISVEGSDDLEEVAQVVEGLRGSLDVIEFVGPSCRPRLDCEGR